MTFGGPYFFVVFFGIFHILGGLVFGKGLRDKLTDPGAGIGFIIWGLIMGVPPTLFDWFFLIQAGNLVPGLIGPILFIIAAIVGGIYFNGEIARKNAQSIISILMGGTALMLGTMITPYLIQQAQTRDNLNITDYLCGGLIPVLFIGVGLSIVSTGFSAVRKNMTFDELVAQREMEAEDKSQGKKEDKTP